MAKRPTHQTNGEGRALCGAKLGAKALTTDNPNHSTCENCARAQRGREKKKEREGAYEAYREANYPNWARNALLKARKLAEDCGLPTDGLVEVLASWDDALAKR